MNMKKLLFVCSENRLRSPTAESIFNEYEGIETIGAGTNNDAETSVSGDLISDERTFKSNKKSLDKYDKLSYILSYEGNCTNPRRDYKRSQKFLWWKKYY